jgi:hypothetical protein
MDAGIGEADLDIGIGSRKVAYGEGIGEKRLGREDGKGLELGGRKAGEEGIGRNLGIATVVEWISWLELEPNALGHRTRTGGGNRNRRWTWGLNRIGIAVEWIAG